MNELMHKKLEAELVSLAHSILQMKNKDDVNALHKKAHDIYEKLSVLKFVDNYLQTTPNTTESKEEIIDRIKEVEKEPETEAIPIDDASDTVSEVLEVSESESVEEVEPETEELVDEVSTDVAIENEPMNEDEGDEITLELEMSDKEQDEEEETSETAPAETLFQTSLEEEFKDAISADEATDLFERATKDDPIIEPEKMEQKRSLNDSIFKHNLQIGLNDRIAFVKNLFDGSQEDFNRVVSQLNSFKTEKEAKTFINKHVKPDYDWTEKESYEERLMDIIERKYL